MSHTRTHSLAFCSAKFTILFSHGNATDIGYMRDHLMDLAQTLQVNVFAYDYCGCVLFCGIIRCRFGKMPSLPSLNAVTCSCIFGPVYLFGPVYHWRMRHSVGPITATA